MTPDYIIIGAGSAGCVLANRLSENPNINVVLIEAGGNDWNPLIHIPAGYIKTMVDPAMNWMFKTVPDPHTGNREILVPRGKVLGGSSAINAMLYVRGQAEDYNIWAKRGNIGWSGEDVLPYFKKSENCQIDDLIAADAGEFRAQGGPLNVEAIRSTYPALDRLIEASETLGYPRNTDYNGASQEGLSYAQTTQKNGMRFSAKRAYLQPARRRKNLHVITNAHVSTLNIDANNTVTGVTYSHKGKSSSMSAGREVILAAGAIQSPQILELSGIGDPTRLQALGITPLHDLSGVGENLSDHYISRLSWRLNQNLSINHTARGLPLLGEIIRYGLTRRGTLSLPAGMICGFVKSSPDIATPDIQYHIANASFADPAKRVFHDFPGFTIGPCQLRPLSRGSVHITANNPFVAPDIVPNFLADPVDQQVHIRAMQIARDLMATELMSEIVDHELTPGTELKSDDELLAYALETGVTLYHPVSTCRMGPNPQKGDVVDARLRVHGMHRLRVVDASIMPELISGNTNAPVMMIAEKAADMIEEDRKQA